MRASRRYGYCLAALAALSVHAQAQAADYLCGFSSSPSDGAYAGERVFTSDASDPSPLACGQVEARRVKLQAYHLVHHGQMSIDIAGASQPLDAGYFVVKVYRTSRADGGPCTDEMEVLLSGVPLYSGALLSDVGASSNGSAISSGAVQFVWARDAQGRKTAWVDQSVSLSSFSGVAAFSCRRID